jgi:hypothetical protein
MTVTFEIPDETAKLLGLTEENVTRTLLEDAVVEAYRADKIGTGQLREILGLGWHEKEALLLRYKIYYEYAPGEIEREVAELTALFKQREAEKTAARSLSTT